MRFSVVAALSTAGFGSVVGRVQDADMMYPLKQRQDQASTTKRFNLTDLPYYEVSYSEDSSPKLLSRFIIALFETDGELPFYPSLFNVEMAVQDFVQAELTSAYAPFSKIENVHAKVVSQKNTASTRNMRSLQMRGSELEMELNVTFANEPSPEIPDVDVALKMAMENMTYFLTNLTKRAEGDKELENVHSAFRLEILDPNPIQEPIDETGGGEAETPSTNNKFIIPLICAACAATLFAGLLVVKRGSKSRDVKAHGRNGNEYGMHWDDESDIFSFETALLQTPHEKALPVKTWLDGEEGTSSDLRYGDEDIGDTRTRFVTNEENSYQFTEIALGCPNSGSVPRSSSEYNRKNEISETFSVANSDDPSHGDSPVTKKAPRSLFNLFSSRSSAPSKSEHTRNNSSGSSDLQMVRHAALAVALTPKEKVITPESCTSSVFTFSDEDEAQRIRHSHDEVMEIVNDIEGVYRSNWDRSKKESTSSLHDHDEPASLSKNEDLSLSGELLGLSFAGLQSTNDATFPPLVHTEPFGSPLLGSGEHLVPPLMSLPVHLQRKSMSDSKIKREKEHIVLRPKSHSDTKLKSHNGLHEGSHGWESEDSTGVKRDLSTNGNGYYDWGIKLRPVKSPMRARKESSELNGDEIHSSHVFLKDTPKEDREHKGLDALWESEELNSVYKIGRRHTKSTVADGSTNYQSEAMDPTDWSVSTGEEGSYASTDVADTTPQKPGKKNRSLFSNLLSGSKTKNVDSLDNNGIVSNHVEQSPVSTATDEQYADAEAETHKEQLISDLAWLENKLALAQSEHVSSPGSMTNSNKNHERNQQLGDESRHPLNSSRGDSFVEDSLSFRSGDQSRSYYGSSLDTTSDFMSPGAGKDSAPKRMQSLLCRDCFAPPGKLKIIIHSTKDGPAIHTVKPDSALTGHIFSGDLIVGVDDVDTRSFTAEQVMKMMTERDHYERKITVLHFDKTEEL